MLQGEQPITVRPADLLAAELDDLTMALEQHAKELDITLAEEQIDDVLTYALFPQIGLKFLQHRGDASAFEQAPSVIAPALPVSASAAVADSAATERYAVKVDGVVYQVEVGPSDNLMIQSAEVSTAAPSVVAESAKTIATEVTAPLAGTIFKVLVKAGQQVQMLSLIHI